MKKITLEEIEHNTGLLFVATKNNNVDEVKRLIPISDPKMENSSAMFRNIKDKDLIILTLLTPKKSVLQFAAEKGYTDIVKALIPVSNPKTNHSGALRIAVINKHIECVKCLIPVSDYQQVLTQMDEQHAIVLQQHIDEYEALMQKERLTKEIKSLNNQQQDNIQKRKM